MALTSSDADIRVLCSRDVVGISAKEDFFRYHNVSLELLYPPNATCLAVRTTIDHVTYYDLRIPKAKYAACGGKPLEVALDRRSDPGVRFNLPSLLRRKTCLTSPTRSASWPTPRPKGTSSGIRWSDWITNVSSRTSGEPACPSRLSPSRRKHVTNTGWGGVQIRSWRGGATPGFLSYQALTFLGGRTENPAWLRPLQDRVWVPVYPHAVTLLGDRDEPFPTLLRRR